VAESEVIRTIYVGGGRGRDRGRAHRPRRRGLEGGYGDSAVLHGVTLDVRPAEIFAILGKNGMGKTTLLKTMMGLLPARGGRVESSVRT